MNIEEAESRHITDPDSCSVPSSLSLEYGYRGYFDLNTDLSAVNLTDGEKIPAELHLVYDPTEQYPDTLLLRFYYRLHLPADWQKTNLDYGRASCDISSLANLQPWRDSVTVILQAGDERKYLSKKISKNDFFKPDIKIK